MPLIETMHEIERISLAFDSGSDCRVPMARVATPQPASAINHRAAIISVVEYATCTSKMRGFAAKERDAVKGIQNASFRFNWVICARYPGL